MYLVGSFFFLLKTKRKKNFSFDSFFFRVKEFEKEFTNKTFPFAMVKKEGTEKEEGRKNK